MRIIFNRSGGFMGLKSNLTVDVDDLAPDQAKTLSRLIDEAHFFTLTENPPSNPTPDGFQYTIIVESETATHTVHTSDTSAPEELRPLLQELSQMARSQRKP
jgi:hypothetical protein